MLAFVILILAPATMFYLHCFRAFWSEAMEDRRTRRRAAANVRLLGSVPQSVMCITAQRRYGGHPAPGRNALNEGNAKRMDKDGPGYSVEEAARQGVA